MSYRFEVALSFASEQRSEANQIYTILSKAGIRVFYDEAFTAEIWGTDLLEYLTDVYLNQSRFCIMLVSKAYAEKVWTTAERRSAQARAMASKDQAYILPVRFDDTPLPGLLPTVAHLPYARYGAQGVCDIFMQKSGHQPAGKSMINSITASCDHSPFAFIVITNGPHGFMTVASSRWGSREVKLVLEPEEAGDAQFLDQLRTLSTESIVVYEDNMARCRTVDCTQVTASGKRQWEFDLRIEQSDFSIETEMGTSGTSPDDFAKIRARRILLNETPSLNENSRNLNEIFHEAMIQGIGSKVEVKGSHFPQLFRQYGGSPMRFLQFAWILAAYELKLSGTIEQMLRLDLKLLSDKLEVDFLGRRKRIYSNRPAYEIAVRGTCPLA